MANASTLTHHSTTLPSSASLSSSLPSSYKQQEERQALRSVLVQLFETEESLPSDYLPELNIPPNTAILAFKSRYRERRLGSASAGVDILGSSVVMEHNLGSSTVLPADRLATTVTYSGFADPSIIALISKSNPNEDMDTNGNNNGNNTANPTNTTTNMVLQQRENHVQNLILSGSHTFTELLGNSNNNLTNTMNTMNNSNSSTSMNDTNTGSSSTGSNIVMKNN
jgi:hypothetical protein